MNTINKLTFKQKGFVRDLIKTRNPTEAVKRNYNLKSKKPEQRESVATSIASENLTKPDIQKEITRLLEAEGLSEINIIKRLKWLLNHKNYNAVAKALEFIFKIRGDFAPDRQEIDLSEITIQSQIPRSKKNS